MRETTKQNLAILLITLFLGGSLYLFINYINPLIERYQQLKKEIEEEKIKISKIKEYRQKSEELIKTYSNLQEEVSKINLALPDNSQTAQLIAIFDKLFKDNNISVNSITFSEGTKDDYKYLEIKLNFSSTYEIFKQFSKEIEKELRLMDYDKVIIKALTQPISLTQITTKKTKTKTTQPISPYLNFDLSIFAYYLPLEGIESNTTSSNTTTP